jgi:hypothetical protein
MSKLFDMFCGHYHDPILWPNYPNTKLGIDMNIIQVATLDTFVETTMTKQGNLDVTMVTKWRHVIIQLDRCKQMSLMSLVSMLSIIIM